MSRDPAQPGTVTYAGLWVRALALLFDGLLFCAAFFPITRWVKGVWLMGPADHRWSHGSIAFDPLCLYFLIVIFAYFVLLEGLLGATIGKMLVQIRVVRAEGGAVTLAQSAIRNLLRFVDGLPALNLLGIVLIVTSPEKARFGDRAAGTRVVRAGG